MARDDLRELVQQAGGDIGRGVQRGAGAAAAQHHRPALQPRQVLVGGHAVAQRAGVTAAIAAVPLKHDPHWPAFSRSK